MKTNLLTIVILLASISLSAQIIKPTRYYLDSLKKVTTEQNSKYIRVVENYKNQEKLFLFTDYYLSGKVNMKAISTRKDKPYFQGPQIDYYESGNKKQESNYIDNNLNGKQVEWYENGDLKVEKEISWDSQNKNAIIKIMQFWNKDKQQTVIDGNGQYEQSDEIISEKGEIKNGKKQGVWYGNNLKENYSFSEIYRDGEFISGISADKDNNKHPYKILTEKADYKNGMQDFYRFIGKNYRCPSVQGLKGKVYITFIVETDGSLSEFKILRDIGHGTGEEAIRVLRKSEKWIPGKMRGMPARVSYSLPITISAAPESNNNIRDPYESEMLRNTNPNW